MRPPLRALAVVPAALTLALILGLGVNLPYWDEWVHLQAVVAYFDGTLTFADLFAQYNESRKVFPRLLIIALWNVCADQRAQMLVSWALAVLTVLCVGLLARQQRLPGYFLPVAATLLLSLVQWQNWLWGIQFVCFTPMAVLAVILVLCQRETARPGVLTAVCAALCTVATYSYANGMLLFLLAAAALRGHPGVRWRKHLLPFALLATVMIGAYFVGYTRPAWTPTPADSLSDPGRAAGYFLALLGGTMTPREASAAVGLSATLAPIAIGSVLLGLLAYGGLRARRTDPGAARPWLLISAYSLISLAVTTAGRSPFGIDNALLSRYTTFALPLAVATAALLILAGRARLAAATSAAMVVLTAAASLAVLPRVAEVSERQQVGRVMLHFCLTAPEATQTTFVADFPQHPLIIPTARRLRDRGLFISPDGDLRPLLGESLDTSRTIAAAIPQTDGSLRVVRVIPTPHPPLPPTPPPQATWYGVRE